MAITPELSERINLAGLHAGAGIRRSWRILAMPVHYLKSIAAGSPNRLIIAPQDIRTADATVAAEIYSGYFAFASKAVNTHGNSPFVVVSPSPEWEAVLMGFGWLRDLRAADTPLAKANARALVDEWISLCGAPSRTIAWEPKVAARRLLSWLSHSPLILEEADLRFYRRFMKSIGRHIAFLRRELSGGLQSEPRILAAIALTAASLCAEGMNRLQRRSRRLLVGEINRQIVIDGAHISRNPQVLMDLLLDFLPLRQAFVARNLTPPPELVRAIDRMMPMLRLFRHGDGAMALFNGMGVTHQEALLTGLAYDDARARPIMHAIASGYQRVEAGDIVLIADMGRQPPAAHSSAAHAGTLSFEFSAGGQRIVVNCGAPAAQSGAMRDAARLTAAHSTLVVGDVSSSRFANGPAANRWLTDRRLTDKWFADRWLAGRIIAGPQYVTTERFESSDGVTIQGSHDGYARGFGLVHERGIAVNSDGSAISGRDRLGKAKKGTPRDQSVEFAVRFHLHPQIKVGLIDDGKGALLVTPNNQQWIFRADNLSIDIKESIFFASPDGTRTTQQLVIAGEALPGVQIDWTFERQYNA